MNNNYENKTFSYSYPYTWDRRNKIYLKKYEDRQKIKDYIMPLVFRLRFYSFENEILSDNFYTSIKNKISFPIIETENDNQTYWSFMYNNELVYITSENYEQLEIAINEGYNDIKLTATYENQGN